MKRHTAPPPAAICHCQFWSIAKSKYDHVDCVPRWQQWWWWRRRRPTIEKKTSFCDIPKPILSFPSLIFNHSISIVSIVLIVNICSVFAVSSSTSNITHLTGAAHQSVLPSENTSFAYLVKVKRSNNADELILRTSEDDEDEDDEEEDEEVGGVYRSKNDRTTADDGGLDGGLGSDHHHTTRTNHSGENTFVNADNVDYVMHSPRTVNTKYGSLQGIVITFVRELNSTRGHGTRLTPVEAFLGVPYASPPSGNLRFMPPVAPTHWRGVRQANHLSAVCPQTISPYMNSTESGDVSRNISERLFDRLQRQLPFVRNQSEDCLHLNIYVPFEQYFEQRHHHQQQHRQQQRRKQYNSFDADPSPSNGNGEPSKYAVIVFISGDSYSSNTGNSFDASIWSSFGQVIVVTLNYRLGVLGFLPAMVDGAIRGNYGLMDQVAALHWIQENIGEFGGNPANVTVVGHGFGAACVHLLLLSPMAKGLFNRVVLMSGSALSPFAIARDAENYARLLAKELNCPVYDNVQLVDCLKRKSVQELLSVHLTPFRHLSAFGPIVDGIVVPSEPRIMMESLAFDRKKPTGNEFVAHYEGDIMFGVTRVECPLDVFSGYDERYGIDLERRDHVLRTLVRNLFDFHQQTIFWTLINEYTDWSRPSEHPINLLDSSIDILGDALVVAPLIDTAELFAKSSEFASPTEAQHRDSNPTSGRRLYSYVFHKEEDADPVRPSVEQRLGSMHGSELDYLFGAPLAIQLTGRSLGHFATNLSKPTDVSLSETIITYFSNFAKFGNPSIMDGNAASANHSSGNGYRSSRFEPSNWPVYSLAQRRYLLIGPKARVRDHYHSHRLSFWLNLIPRLLMEQFSKRSHDAEELLDLFEKDDIGLRYIRHHLLDNYDDVATYDGPVRQITLKSLTPYSGRKLTPTGGWLRTSSGSLFSDQRFNDSINPGLKSTSHTAPNSGTGSANKSLNGLLTNETQQTESGNYSTALSVTIAVGCSLLILNMMIFAGVYYQLDRHSKSRTNSPVNGASAIYGQATASVSSANCVQTKNASTPANYIHYDDVRQMKSSMEGSGPLGLATTNFYTMEQESQQPRQQHHVHYVDEDNGPYGHHHHHHHHLLDPNETLPESVLLPPSSHADNVNYYPMQSFNSATSEAESKSRIRFALTPTDQFGATNSVADLVPSSAINAEPPHPLTAINSSTLKKVKI